MPSDPKTAEAQTGPKIAELLREMQAVNVWQARELARLRRVEDAARVQWEAYGAYPGLIAALQEKTLEH